LNNIIAHLTTKTSIAGFSAIAGAISAYLSGAATASAALSAIAASIVLIALPENTQLQQTAGTVGAEIPAVISAIEAEKGK